jgi:hypothetical protein
MITLNRTNKLYILYNEWAKKNTTETNVMFVKFISIHYKIVNIVT